MTTKRKAPARPPGRRAQGPKIDPEKAEKMLSAIRTGVAMDTAAQLVGIPRSTFFYWIKKGREEGASKPYRDFVARVDVALADFESRGIALIAKAGQEEWQAIAWLFERKMPEKYGRRTRVDSNVTVAAQPFIDASKLTLDEQETLLKLLRKASPAAEELSEGQRPALELVAGDADVIDGEATEVA